MKFRATRIRAEGFLFHSDISDGIETDSTGGRIQRLPVYQNVNVGKLRRTGAEAAAEVVLSRGVTVVANWSTTKSTNVSRPNSPVGVTYTNKLNLSLGWSDHAGRFWGEYVLRHNGEQKDIMQGSSRVGDVLPAFTVHAVRGGIRGWQIGSVRQDITLAVNNLANTLYAEAANSGFLRPEAGRSVSLALVFSAVLFRRWSERGGLRLTWWGLGALTFAAGTITESLTTLTGWHEALFRAWYVTGAPLGGAPLAQGSVYLHLTRQTANRLTVALVSAIVIASTCVLFSPIHYDQVEHYHLTGRVFAWTWVRAFSPFINSYAVIFLIGGAMLPGVGGTFTPFRHTEVLYVTEFIGLSLIIVGYLYNVGASTASNQSLVIGHKY